MADRSMGVPSSRDCNKVVNFNYTSSLVTQKIFANPTSKPLLLTHILGIPRVPGSAGQLSFYRVGNGIAVANGVLLHTGFYDMTAAADTVQLLNLLSLDTCTFQQNDSLGYVLSGTPTSAVGFVEAIFEPIP